MRAGRGATMTTLTHRDLGPDKRAAEMSIPMRIPIRISKCETSRRYLCSAVHAASPSSADQPHQSRDHLDRNNPRPKQNRAGDRGAGFSRRARSGKKNVSPTAIPITKKPSHSRRRAGTVVTASAVTFGSNGSRTGTSGNIARNMATLLVHDHVLCSCRRAWL